MIISLPIVLVLAGLGAILAAIVLLRSLGPRYRIGRLLSASPSVSIDDALTIAGGAPSYVRVSGRISSEEEFPDDHERPLVFRRTRIELSTGGDRWTAVFDEQEAVPFGIEARSSFIAVDESAVAHGLVAIPRESTGSAADLPADLSGGVPAGTNPSTPTRLVIEQLSAVEHATVCGVPTMRDGQPLLGAGLGRPLIVTTLEQGAAMRVLASGRRGTVLAATALLLGGLALLVASMAAALIG